jgi:phosphoesterase RecJ-like protein
MTLAGSYADAVAALRAAPRVVVVTHESPDGDALGSLVAAARGLRLAGLEAHGVIADAPVPREYRWLASGEVADGIGEGPYVVLAVDCGSEARIAGPAGVVAGAATVVNVDHHHDNTRFGSVNVVDGVAPCASIMVAEVLERLGVTLDLPTATALYVGLVTDTGRFQYSNTTPAAFAFAARLTSLGVEPGAVFARLYEGVPASRVRLHGRALAGIAVDPGGLLASTVITRQDFADAGADDAAADGVIESVRAIEGVEVAAVIRELPDGAGHKVSLRSGSGAVDVSAIARTGGGGGHPRAAGFASTAGVAAILTLVREGVARHGAR